MKYTISRTHVSEPLKDGDIGTNGYWANESPYGYVIQPVYPDVEPIWSYMDPWVADLIARSQSVEVTDFGPGQPFGFKKTVIDNSPDKPRLEVDTYFRRLGSNNENYWQRVRAGEIVVQDHFFTSRCTAFFEGAEVFTKPVILGRVDHFRGIRGNRFYPPYDGAVNDRYGNSFNYHNVNGRLMNIDCTSTMEERLTSLGVLQVDDFGYEKSKWTSFIPRVYTPDVNCDLFTEALSEANDATVDLLTELAELPETARYAFQRIKDFLRILADMRLRRNALTALTKYRKRRKRESLSSYNAYKHKKALSDSADAMTKTWMEFRYAIMTTVYSLQDLHDFFLHAKQVYKTTRKREYVDFPDEWVYIPNGWSLDKKDITFQERVWIKRKYDPGDVFDQLLKQLKVNVFATAWELIPLSFVVDWFVNVGDLINALTGYQPYLQSKELFSRSCRGTIVLKHDNSEAKVRINVDTYHRFVINDAPISFLNIENGMDFFRSLDALSILWNPIKNKLKKENLL